MRRSILLAAAALALTAVPALAQNFSEDPNTASNGGDMGFIPESALAQANPKLREMVMSMQPGGVSGVINTGEGYRILKVLSKEPAGQRELNDPRVQQSIRETLLNRKDSLLKLAYYDVARNQAKGWAPTRLTSI